jgi:hypothetical protein
MDRFAYLLLIFIFAACDNLTEVEKGGLTFYFTDNVSVTRQTVMVDYIVDELKELKLEELKIKDIKVDSLPFSIVLYVPYSNEITKEIEDDFKSMANLLSHFDLDQTPVHIVLTDNNFNPKKNLLYDKNAVAYSGKRMVRGRAEVQLSESASRFSSGILEEVLRNRMPELYKGTDSVKISVDMVKDTIKIDFNIDRNENNLDTLRKQFLDTDKLFFKLLFERRTILFHLRDKRSKELITVFGVRGE